MSKLEKTTPPLEDQNYEPIHVPVRGRPPEVVKKWGPRSQLRWFQRFWSELYANIRGMQFPGLANDIAGEYYCHSLQHRGPCCSSCIEDAEYDSVYDPYPLCCCRSEYSAATDDEDVPRL